MMFCSVILSAQSIESFVTNQFTTYPNSRLLDIYKSCFQDFMGAEHLVGDRQSVEAYLDEELKTTKLSDLMSWYFEPCGVDQQYVRVSLRAIMEGLITKDQLLDAFVRSANSEKRPTVDEWRKRWQGIIECIDRMCLSIPHYKEDRQFIENILSEEKYAISHSSEYRETYHPHYRIVAKDIFEKEIKPNLKND